MKEKILKWAKLGSLLLLVALLSACAATSYTGGGNEDSAYFLISEGGANGITKIVTGDVRYCKITQNNLAGTEFDVSVEYFDGKCKVEAISSDKDSEVRPE